jgi:hypothetical protein
MKTLNDKDYELLKDFLDDYSQVLSNNSCNDWNFPEDWTQEEVDEFVGLYTFANFPSNPNGDGVCYSNWAKNRYMPDSCVLAVLRYKMERGL